MYSLPPQRSGKRGRPREKGDRLPSLAELAVAPGDPDTPEVNSLVPSVNVVVTNSDGDVLLIRRSDNQNWAVPGGGIDLGESMVSAAVRETKEETGIEREVTGLVGIYTDPKHVILYTSSGEVRQEFSILLTARATSGVPTRSDESSEVQWVPRVSLDRYSMDRSMRLRLSHFLEGRARPCLG
jgi:ADP-ribose pyrophosphatase YjhB (NUDIX family)